MCNVPQLHLLDTDIASYIIKRHPPAVERRLAELPLSHVCVSAVTRAELMYGLARLPKVHQLQVGVRAFLRVVRALPWDGEAADRYATIRHDLTRTGHLIGELDMMIAAHALAADAVLVTNNVKHYARIEAPLQLANWSDAPESTA